MVYIKNHGANLCWRDLLRKDNLLIPNGNLVWFNPFRKIKYIASQRCKNSVTKWPSNSISQSLHPGHIKLFKSTCAKTIYKST